MTVTKQATVFTAPSGKAFVYLTDMPFQDGEVLYSPDGDTFYALASRGFGGSTEEHDLSFDDPHHGVSGKLYRNGKVITYDGELYVQQDASFDQSGVVPLPPTRRGEYLCQFDDGRLLYVSRDVYNWSYEGFRLYIGDGETMQEYQNLRTSRYRDGGTTYIETPAGVFYSPSPFRQGQRPNWTTDEDMVPEELTKLNLDDYDILEEDGTVIISKR